MKQETSPDLQRALFLLYERFDNVDNLYGYWRCIGNYRVKSPAVERCRGYNWWENLKIN